MKNRYTYKLIVQSEDKRRNTLEMALYVLVAISALLSIWQFAEQPSTLSLETTERTSQETVATKIAS